jgi:acetylornithine/succinyldiaminopimelate/putrescine aminotransferase
MNVAQILRQGFEDYRRFVNPGVAERAELSREPMRIVRALEGQLVTDAGEPIEDFHGTQAFGHRNPAIADAVRAFLDSDSPSWFPSRVNPYAGSLARRLCERAGAPYGNVYFASSGSEAVEAAIKLARAVTKRPRVLSLSGAYHGCTMGSCALMAEGVYRDLFGPHVPGLSNVPFGNVDALRTALTDDVAAIVVEPIQVEGGVRALPEEYIAALCAITEQRGILLVADEVQTGLGRTGRFLASERWPRRPDAVLLGKHLGGGLMPISAMITHADLFARAYGGDLETSEAHNCTFSGNAVACVAAHAALDVLTPALIERVATTGAWFRSAIAEALSGLPLFDEVRGDGLTVGIALRPSDHPWLSFEHFGMEALGHHPTVGLLLCHRLYARGYFGFVCGHDWRVLRVQPRFNVPKEQLETFIIALREELTKLCEVA